MSSQQPDRALFLFDGPNFYKNLKTTGLNKGHLDYSLLATNLAGPRTIVEIIFFTSPTDQQTDARNYANQQRFFNNLKENGITLKLGHLVDRTRECSVCHSLNHFKVEKSVDVLIAMELVIRCIEDDYDVAYLATCDSDLVPAISFVRSKGKDVFLLWPEKSRCHAVAEACRVSIPIKQTTLDAAQVAFS